MIHLEPTPDFTHTGHSIRVTAAPGDEPTDTCTLWRTGYGERGLLRLTAGKWVPVPAAEGLNFSGSTCRARRRLVHFFITYDEPTAAAYRDWLGARRDTVSAANDFYAEQLTAAPTTNLTPPSFEE